jgi:hypothetical protein
MPHVLILALLSQAAAARQPPAAKKPDACMLLADADVHAVLGVTVKERQPGTQQARGLLLSQCYLGTGTPRSVSIALAGNTRSGGKTLTPRAFWRDQFHGRDEQTSARKGGKPEAARKGETREQGETARPIGGVGDEAFWSGTRVAGALYVLRGNTFIRVSVGGISDEKERIEKSRQLAVTALARLPPPRQAGAR